MKKMISLLLFIAVAFSIYACGENRTEEKEPEDYASVESISQINTEAEDLQPEDVSDEAMKDTAPDSAVNPGERNLIVYFSRMGNTEYPEGIDASTSASLVADNDIFGTTEYVARMVQESVGGELYLIQTKEPYPADFDELRNLNHEEMDTKKPAMRRYC